MFCTAHVVVFDRRRRIALGVALGAVLSLCAFVALPGSAAAADPPLKVVATFSVLGDMVKEIGGGHVALTTLVGPGADAHNFEPAPEDVKALADAQILVLNGLDFEAWLPRLITSAGFKGTQVLASEGVRVRHLDAGDVDPHAWQSLDNGAIYAKNIVEALSKATPAHRAYYKNRAKLFVEQMKKLDTEIRLALDDIPPGKRKVVSSHDAFGYFSQAYDIQFIALTGLANEAEPSAKEMAAIIDTVKKEGVTGVFVENTANPKLASQIARETGAKVGGTLYSDTLANADQPASNYLGMFTWNAGQLIYVLKDSLIKD
ncbi:MAG: metal ABC transporter substrate-binding protein [Pusillimonas sp.]